MCYSCAIKWSYKTNHRPVNFFHSPAPAPKQRCRSFSIAGRQNLRPRVWSANCRASAPGREPQLKSSRTAEAERLLFHVKSTGNGDAVKCQVCDSNASLPRRVVLSLSLDFFTFRTSSSYFTSSDITKHDAATKRTTIIIIATLSVIVSHSFACYCL